MELIIIGISLVIIPQFKVCEDSMSTKPLLSPPHTYFFRASALLSAQFVDRDWPRFAFSSVWQKFSNNILIIFLSFQMFSIMMAPKTFHLWSLTTPGHCLPPLGCKMTASSSIFWPRYQDREGTVRESPALEITNPHSPTSCIFLVRAVHMGALCPENKMRFC